MESRELRRAKRKAIKNELTENINKHSRFNFGVRGKAVLTSTSNSKAHSFNSFDRRRMELHNQNIDKMVNEFEAGIVATPKKARVSKNARRYNQRIASKIENYKINSTIAILHNLFDALDINPRMLNVG